MYTHMDFTGKGFIGSAKAESSNGTKFGTVRIAKTDAWKNKETGEKNERTHWFTVMTFVPQHIEMIEKGWLAKGRYIEVSGELRENRWTDKDENEHVTVQLIAERVNFLDPKPAEE